MFLNPKSLIISGFFLRVHVGCLPRVVYLKDKRYLNAWQDGTDCRIQNMIMKLNLSETCVWQKRHTWLWSRTKAQDSRLWWTRLCGMWYWFDQIFLCNLLVQSFMIKITNATLKLFKNYIKLFFVTFLQTIHESNAAKLLSMQNADSV